MTMVARGFDFDMAAGLDFGQRRTHLHPVVLDKDGQEAEKAACKFSI